MNKKLAITLIILLSIISILLTSLLVYLLTTNKSFSFFNKVSNELIIDNIYDKDFNIIDINSSASNIYIKKSSDNNYKVMVYGNKDKIKIDDSDNKLYIKEEDSNCIGFCFNYTINKIEIYIPEEYANTIRIDNDYGNIEVDKFTNAKLDIDSDYGNINIDKVNYANIKLDCGNIDIDEVTSINVVNNYGNIKINNVLEYIDSKNDCGDIIINNLNLTKDSYIKNNLGNIKVNNTNEIFIDAKVNLGNIKINNNYNRSDITLKVDNDCGNIEIKN